MVLANIGFVILPIIQLLLVYFANDADYLLLAALQVFPVFHLAEFFGGKISLNQKYPFIENLEKKILNLYVPTPEEKGEG